MRNNIRFEWGGLSTNTKTLLQIERVTESYNRCNDGTSAELSLLNMTISNRLEYDEICLEKYTNSWYGVDFAEKSDEYVVIIEFSHIG